MSVRTSLFTVLFTSFISLLIFCLVVVSFIENGVLSLTMILALSYFSDLFCKFLLPVSCPLNSKE